MSEQRERRIGLYDEGQGEPVVLLHSSASSSHQWRHLKKEIGGRYRLLAVDLYGYGQTAFPEPARDFSLDNEVALVELLIDRVDGPFHLVGHSYGAAVALHTALKHDGRVGSLFLHEPVLFQLLRMEGHHAEWQEIEALGARVAECVEQGRNNQAAEVFIDYWSGNGAWAAIPDHRKDDFARAAPKVVLDFRALFSVSQGRSDYQQVSAPVRLTAGSASARTARQVATLLSEALGPGSLHVVEGVGHMAPMTHPDRINPLIIRHLQENPIRAT